MQKAVVFYFHASSWHVPGRNKEDHKNVSQDRWSLARDFNLEPPVYEVAFTVTRQGWRIRLCEEKLRVTIASTAA